MSKKKVLIVTRRELRKNKLINWVSEIYLQILAKGGVLPILVPISQGTIANLPDYLSDYDGLLMSEGGDISPSYYNEPYSVSKLDEYDPIKDEIEIACCRHAVENNKPVLGLCRGMHMINVVFGGSLHLDVHEINHRNVVHIDYNNYDSHRHPIQLFEGTPLYDWYKEPEISVNTYHHQGIKKLGNELIPMAKAPDGLIEGIYNPHYKFIVGLQFHPERMYQEHSGNKQVFNSFIEAL
ncbi:MAG: type 1 glutamine amidotransferase [Dysgonamonadaceae bacterium]